MTRLIAAALLAGTAIATPATAAPLFFDFVANDGSQSVSFTLDSNPVANFVGSTGLTFNTIPLTTSTGIVVGDVSFFTTNALGGFLAQGAGRYYTSTTGSQLFSGTMRNPIFTPSTFALKGYFGDSGGVLTISAATPAAVPEPATWAMMILGMGAVGYAMRRRQKVTAKVRFA
ncbi:PEPxxWA-CTERM sorting domain-containing protein [Sphingomonas sp. DT-51]|uniref:PEPxxWA-CTERM sorting domain-containing protein n=1 Tax=Sphingomonas sp. DT-51 TaxID=3396165 RepID=UPI003F1A6DB3